MVGWWVGRQVAVLEFLTVHDVVQLAGVELQFAIHGDRISEHFFRLAQFRSLVAAFDALVAASKRRQGRRQRRSSSSEV